MCGWHNVFSDEFDWVRQRESLTLLDMTPGSKYDQLITANESKCVLNTSYYYMRQHQGLLQQLKVVYFVKRRFKIKIECLV